MLYLPEPHQNVLRKKNDSTLAQRRLNSRDCWGKERSQALAVGEWEEEQADDCYIS
jgi:hypothetical protein